jgi:putative RecB family exonuclease
MPKITEDKVWIETVNGELNPNSFASIAAMGTASLAVDVLSKAGIELKGSTVKALNFTFLSIVSDAQFNWTGSRSLMDGANTRMRGALRSVIDSMPLPFGQDEAAWDAWVDAALRRCKAITSVGLSGYHEEAPARPWSALAGVTAVESAEPAKAATKARAKAPAKVVAEAPAEAPVEAPVAEAPAVEAPVEATVTPIKAAPKSAGFSSHDFPDEDEDAA